MSLKILREHFGVTGPSWLAWRAWFGGIFGSPLNKTQRRIFKKLTKRKPLKKPPREVWLAVGRRGGKNYFCARVAIYLALFGKWKLSPGEVGVVLLLAVDRAQAKVAYEYLRGCLESTPLLQQEVESITANTITLRNGVEIQIGTSDFAAVRGRTLLTVICDEFAFWPHDQAKEILRAIRPGMGTQPQAMLIVISSVYSQRGPFYEAYRKYYGKDDPRVVFALADTRTMNPTFSQENIDAEIAEDPAAASAEYLSIFRSDLEQFIDAALLDACTRNGPRELPHLSVTPEGRIAPTYYAGIDVSGGRGDAAACGVAHRDGDRIVIDAVRRWPAPHDPLVVAKAIAEFLKTYGLTAGIADAYGADFATSGYREAGVTLHPAGVNRSEAYLHLLPLLTTGRIELPDDPRLRSELLTLERRTGRSGKDSIDHASNGHDDVANACALAAYAVSRVAVGGDQELVIVRSEAMRGYEYSTEQPLGGFISG